MLRADHVKSELKQSFIQTLHAKREKKGTLKSFIDVLISASFKFTTGRNSKVDDKKKDKLKTNPDGIGSEQMRALKSKTKNFDRK